MSFNSIKFQTFSEDWNFKITTFNPQHAQSNGLAEKEVCIVKSMLKKSKDTGIDFELFLLMYRNTPVAGLQYSPSPSQLLQSRELRSSLKINEKNFKPNSLNAMTK